MIIKGKITYTEQGQYMDKIFNCPTTRDNLKDFRRQLELIENEYTGKERKLVKSELIIGSHTIEIKTAHELELVSDAIHAVIWTIANEV